MLEYNEETRVHYIDGIKVPSVTSVLPKEDIYVSAEVYESARIDGVDRHIRIERYLDSRDTNFDLMLEKFAEMIDEIRPGKMLIHEQPLFSRKHMFCGKPDVIFESAIWDIKRSFGKSRRHALQLAAYDILREENGMGTTNEWWIIVWDGRQWKRRNVYTKYQESRKWFLTLLEFYHYYYPQRKREAGDGAQAV